MRRPAAASLGCNLPPLPKLKGSLGVKKNAKLKRSTLAAGQQVALTCNLSSSAKAVLTISKALAKSLKIGTTVGTGTAKCNADGRKLKLKLGSKAAKKLKGKKVSATLTTTFTRKGSKAFKFVLPVKIV